MNQPAVNGGFAPQTLFLGLAASSLASSFLKTEELSARSFLLWGLPAALALCLLSALLAAESQARELFSGKGVFSRLGCGVSGLWFAVELIRTVRTAQEVCWSQFSSMAALSVLPLLLWAGWALPEAVLDRSSRVLWWLAGLGALLCAAGLAGQLHWQNLFPASYRFTGADFGQILYPEYFALTFLCPQRQWRKAVWMPLGSFGVQAAFCFGMALLFGARQGSGLPGYELLRSWTLGAFSRFDAVFLLLWLAAMFFRICVLAHILRLLWEKFCGRSVCEVSP